MEELPDQDTTRITPESATLSSPVFKTMETENDPPAEVDEMNMDQSTAEAEAEKGTSTPMEVTAAPCSSSAGAVPVVVKPSKSKVKNFALCDSSLLPHVSEKNLRQAFKTPCSSNINVAKGKGQTSKKRKTNEESKEEADGFEVVSMPIDSSVEDVAHESEAFSTPIPTVPAEPAMSAFVTAAIATSQRVLTENLGPTFSTSNDPRLDFFFGVMEQTSYPGAVQLLKDSWTAGPLDTLKLLANLRDIRGGKGIRPQYQQCLYWMYENHPQTLYDNLGELVQFGYWKDVLHFLIIVLFDGYMHPYFEKDANPVKVAARSKNKKSGKASKGKSSNPVYVARQVGEKADMEKRIYNQLIADHYKIGKEVSKIPKNEMQALRLKYAREKFKDDVKYRVFHVKVAEIFAAQLIKDLIEHQKPLEKGVRKNVSLAGKWAPSLEKHFDRYSLIASTIAVQIVKQSGKHQDILQKPIPVATYLARKWYNKDYCLPLRRYQEIPEHFMSTNQWGSLKYQRVPAKCMQMNKSHFIKHDKSRFEEYLKKYKVAGASLKPVELICEAMSLDKKEETEQLVVEKQWESLVENIKKTGGGLLKNAVAICDVSGSMSGIPMKAAIGLTLLTMAMTEAPWNTICITFSEAPEIFNLDTTMSLKEKLTAMKAMNWGGTTNFQKTFDHILSIGKENNLSDKDMPKLLLVFTDMEFNAAFPGTNMTNFEAAKAMFETSGYTMPSIVFWNLRDSQLAGGSWGRMSATSTPVQKNELGVSLLSGFSGQLLTYVMKENDLSKCTPLQFMLEVVNDPKYSKLAIYD